METNREPQLYDTLSKKGVFYRIYKIEDEKLFARRLHGEEDCKAGQGDEEGRRRRGSSETGSAFPSTGARQRCRAQFDDALLSDHRQTTLADLAEDPCYLVYGGKQAGAFDSVALAHSLTVSLCFSI